jgi:chromosome segregation ATPase
MTMSDMVTIPANDHAEMLRELKSLRALHSEQSIELEAKDIEIERLTAEVKNLEASVEYMGGHLDLALDLEKSANNEIARQEADLSLLVGGLRAIALGNQPAAGQAQRLLDSVSGRE